MLASSVMFGLGILVVLFAWRHIATPSIVDHYRDKLFDLRAEVREHYLDQPDGLTSPDYKLLRDLINAQILFIEKVSIFAVVHLLAMSKADPEASDAFRTTSVARLEREPVGSYVHSTRMRSARIVLEFASKSSLAVWAAAVTIAPFAALFTCTSIVLKALATGGRRALELPRRVAFAQAMVVLFSLFGLQGKFRPSVESVIEQAASENYRQEAHMRSAQPA
jgi:hypothetical protein